MFLIVLACPFLLNHLVGQVQLVKLLLPRINLCIKQFNCYSMLLLHRLDLLEILLNVFRVLVFHFLDLPLLLRFLSAVFCCHLIVLLFELYLFLQVVLGHLPDRVLQLKYPLIGILGLKHGSLVKESEVGDGILEHLREELVSEVEERLSQILFCLLQFSV